EARFCLRFNEKVATRSDITYGGFVRTEPNLDAVVTARDDTLCINGLPHGGTHDVEVLAGLPAAAGEKDRGGVKAKVTRPDRKPSISFSGTGYVLVRDGSAGLPVTTINLDKVKVRLLRVNDRNLVPSIDSEKLTMSFGSDDVEEVINRTGSLVWKGEMAVAG